MSRSTPKKPAKSPDPRIPRHVTPGERAELARLERAILTRLEKGEALAWQVGRLIDRIARAGLHHAAGTASLEEYCDARFPQGSSTLARYRRVAMRFSEATVKKHGMTKLDLALTYIDLTPEHETAHDVPGLVIAVPAGGKEMQDVPFAKATVRQLEKAIASVQAKPTARDTPLGAWAKLAGAALQAKVAAPKGTHRHAPRVRAYPHPEGQKTLRFDLVGIDLDDLARIAQALAHARIPRAPQGHVHAVA